MKYQLRIIIAIWGGLFCSGCDHFLDVKPSTSVAVPSGIDDYKGMLYNNAAEYADYMLGVLGDDVYWNKNYYLSNSSDVTIRRAYLWEDVVFDITIKPRMWGQQYANIYTCNKVIAEVRQVEGVAPEKLAEVEAEARFFRALNYFHLVSLFAKPYAMASDNDPGIPVIVRNDVTEVQKERTPVREVYRHILSELDSTLRYLPDYPSMASRHLPSRLGAYGLKAKVYFNMQEYALALKEIEKVFKLLETESSPQGFEYTLLDYNNLALQDESQPWIGMDWMAGFPSCYDMETEDVESVFTANLNIQWDPTIGNIGFWPSNAIFASSYILSLFRETGDLREKFMLYDRNQNGQYWEETEPGLKLKKYGYSNQGVSMPDLYLMAAECYARGENLKKALQFLNDLRAKRFVDPAILESTDLQQILTWILEERMREFIATGHRWLDMRRLWNDPVGKTLIQKKRTLDGQVYTLTENRLTLRIPEYVMQYHPDWKQNP